MINAGDREKKSKDFNGVELDLSSETGKKKNMKECSQVVCQLTCQLMK